MNTNRTPAQQFYADRYHGKPATDYHRGCCPGHYNRTENCDYCDEAAEHAAALDRRRAYETRPI